MTFEEWADENNLSAYGAACSRAAWNAAQKAERERIKNIIKEYASGGWVRCCSQILESIEE